MHLWPSLKLRNSFKSSSNKRKQTQSNQQKLLNPETSSSGFAIVCRDLAMLLLSCCFCCGACIGEEEN